MEKFHRLGFVVTVRERVMELTKSAEVGILQRRVFEN